MSFVFDAKAARLYESWYSSPPGRAMERLVERSIPLLLDPQPGEKILDIGCGEGNHLSMFHRLGLDIYGVDASRYMIGRAGKRLHDRATLKVGVAENLPFDDNEFDLVVLINTLEFLDDPLEALREARRVAKRKVLIGVMNSLSWYCLLSKFRSYFRKSLFSHVTLYNMWNLKSYVHSVFGNVPITSRCGHVEGTFLEKFWGPAHGRRHSDHCPFGSFLSLAVDIRYWTRTEQHPLKVGLGEVGHPVARGITMRAHRFAEVDGENERSLLV
jgi:ubiquinone/menaquinone biosynthesis C-methylase UbiE